MRLIFYFGTKESWYTWIAQKRHPISVKVSSLSKDEFVHQEEKIPVKKQMREYGKVYHF